MPFTRGPARSYWATFTSATKEEQFKFGTLVFFSGLTHVGIVADEKGFYHSSRRNGVIYSPFSDYWLSRIDGFRRVTLDSTQARVVTPKPPPRSRQMPRWLTKTTGARCLSGKTEA